MSGSKWVLFIGSVWLLSQPVFAQSLLSRPHWVEHQTPHAPVALHWVNPFDNYALAEAQERAMDGTEPSLSVPPTGSASKKFLPPSSIVFESISKKAEERPQQALTDLEAYRSFLQPEEARILEVQIVFNSQQYGQAEVLAADFLDSFPESIFAPFAYFYEQKSRFFLQKPLANNSAQNNRILPQLSDAFQVDFLHILAEDARRQGNILEAARYFFQQRDQALPPERVADETILQVIQASEDVETLEVLEQDYGHLDFIGKKLPYFRLDLLVKQFQYSPALALIQTLLETEQNPQQREGLLELRQKINVKLRVNPDRIGVILPLSSTNAQIARLTQETLEGLRLGLLSQKNKSPVELVLRDSQINAEASAAAVRELVEKEHVIAIIGPLIRQTSEAAAQEAQRLQVPLISLSLTQTIPDIGSYIFRNNQSWQQEMQALARYAFDYKNAKRFLILHPNTREGRNKMSFFWDEILRLGGTIQGVEGFDLGQKDFVAPFEQFTGLNRPIPPDERPLQEEFEEPLEPLREFDALLIPSGMRGADALKVLLPYAQAYEMKDILFLGDSGWNDYSVMLDLQKHAKDSVFIDSFFKESPQPQVEQFIRLHERYFLKTLNYPGPSSYTAYAYDTVNLLTQTIASLKQKTHEHLQQALLHRKPYPGVTGAMTFLMNGEAHREMEILTLEEGAIVSVK